METRATAALSQQSSPLASVPAAPTLTPPASPVLSPSPSSSPRSSAVPAPRKRRASSSLALSEDDRKRRRQEQNRSAAATSRVKTKERRARLEQHMEQLEQTTQRLRQQRDTLSRELRATQQMLDSTAPSSSFSASASPSSSHPSRRPSPRKSAALASLPWRLLQHARATKPNVTRALTALVLLALATVAAMLTTLLLITHHIHSHLPSSPAPQPHPLLIPSFLTLTAMLLHHHPPNPSSPPFLPSPPSLPPLSLLSSPPLPLRRPAVRPSLAASVGRSPSVRFHPFARTGRGSGIDGPALASLRMRTGLSVMQQQPQLGVRPSERRRGTDATVALHPVTPPPSWMFAMLVLAAVS